MAKTKPTPSSTASVPPPSSVWLPVLVAGVLGGLAGATGTYFVVRPRLHPATAPVTGPARVTAADPAPDLTAGQPPVQAERTLGNFAYDHQDWPGAIQHYEAALRLGANDPDLRTDLGNAYRFAGRATDALAQYELAQNLNPAHEFSLFNQGGLYLEQFHQPLRAVAIWNEYLRRFPQGESAAAARQLIAQAQGGAPGLALPDPAAPIPAATAAPSASEDLILQRIKSAQTAPAKP